jgi:hypothetical protein
MGGGEVSGHWRVRAREAGYDPDRTVDVPQSFGKMILTIEMKDMKGATIGDGTSCSGARCIKRVLDADWAFVGTSFGVIAPKGSRKLLRFMVNGLAQKQDRTMNVVGEKLILRAPTRSDRRGARAKRKAREVEVRSHQRSRPGEAEVEEQKARPQRSLAAMLRSDPT